MTYVETSMENPLTFLQLLLCTLVYHNLNTQVSSSIISYD